MVQGNVILVGVDNSHRSLFVVEQAAQLAVHLQKTLYLVHVVDTELATNQQIQLNEERLAYHFKRQFDQISKDAGVQHVISTTIFGNPAKRLTNLSTLDNVSLAILGANGRHCINTFPITGHIASWSKKSTTLIRNPITNHVSRVPVNSFILND
ncbi:universal stress protein [Lactiplantibacillus mudanjiangensis]|uniref:Universal stress protein [Lactobacillus plantarum subsp. plantarum] n=1 Tax=Lactiplantibacillus mudanjiangensis TaxID=1296538 RepID=A0A660DXI4_9LACO|nr:universal stress protein [Lactiplantibacillus mudanjiangensis]VDG19500.1 universal stress protein [Lactobacillus plantarum subsp. plantarum] [Lactiplantibacillus mudanjiangensis]VDG25803.1 universal stress protein [Lactobacillus plantarum subsp. plantarum] [Lactiplantibacillus mudanjiangensis]VDG28129.1 universal stress protein [Lactobacillus plantarum subsp. plantarum] [Lactiplantibacillus mudanjiangensis]